MSVLIHDAKDPYRFVEVRGSVTMTRDGGPELIEALSQAYEGERYSGDDNTDHVRLVLRLAAGARHSAVTCRPYHGQVSLHLYDSATRSLRPFEPLEPGKASIYLCGATVQGAPHIGHVRSEVNFDILWRWLEYRGYEVTFVRNVTDIDDKILTKAADAGEPWWAWAATYEREFSWAYDELGCRRPTYEPRATGHVTEMVELMQRLIDSEHAYAADGDVYFDVRSVPVLRRAVGAEGRRDASRRRQRGR